MKRTIPLQISAVMIVLLALSACESTSSESARVGAPAVRGQMSDPEIPMDAEYGELSGEAQARAVTYAADAERPDQPPYPKGGWQAVHDRLVLPERAPDGPSAGAVYVEFTLGPDGKVEEASVVEGFSEEVDAAVLAAFRDSEFSPAIKDGVPARVKLRNRVEIAYNDY